jgi:hypothetical protein
MKRHFNLRWWLREKDLSSPPTGASQFALSAWSYGRAERIKNLPPADDY